MEDNLIPKVGRKEGGMVRGDNCWWLLPGVCVSEWDKVEREEDCVSSCLLPHEVKETEGSIWESDVNDEITRQDLLVGFPNCFCVCVCVILHERGLPHWVFRRSPVLGLRERLSHCITDERASALKETSLKWFRITWARWLWSLTSACATLHWYYIIYNDIIDHYVSWHSTLNQYWLINQMMKGGCNSEIKGKEGKTQTQRQHVLRDANLSTCLYSNITNTMSSLWLLHWSYMN